MSINVSVVFLSTKASALFNLEIRGACPKLNNLFFCSRQSVEQVDIPVLNLRVTLIF